MPTTKFVAGLETNARGGGVGLSEDSYFYPHKKMRTHLINHLVLCSTLVLVAARPLPRANDCVGCTASAPATGLAQGPLGQISIEVTVTSGFCLTVPDTDTCAGVPCPVSIVRTWTGVAPGTSVAHCEVINGVRKCETPAPVVGAGGAGNTTRPGDAKCGGSSYCTVAIGAGTNQLIAAATGACSGCQ